MAASLFTLTCSMQYVLLNGRVSDWHEKDGTFCCTSRRKQWLGGHESNDEHHGPIGSLRF